MVLAESHLMLRHSLEELLEAEQDFNVVAETDELATIDRRGFRRMCWCSTRAVRTDRASS